MDPKTSFDEENFDNILLYAREHAGGDYSKGLEVVITTAFSDIRNLPKLRYPKKVEGVSQPVPLKEYVGKWVKKYLKGYKCRPSHRTGNPSNTHSDPVIISTLKYRLPHLSKDDLQKIEEGHSSLMSVENLIGDLLEEYLSIRLSETSWYCCWGSSIDAVDFCNKEGKLLQVKNSDNSENSSSSRVRNGTKIEKWHRRVSTRANTFCWAVLREKLNIDNVSEEDFRAFIKTTMENNPRCFHINEVSALVLRVEESISEKI